ncbi:MAG: hypothetical protein EBR17_04030 [Betaproteobacteria bacterium]|jgi:putative polyhydroxyalkanoate system protein|nr:polyhydroxyalkanoic acid system family protein [Burkholderiales bacterium]NBX14300.1 hypothetical protein [Betaproteobacteria bacterium]NBX89841.1 hypothetical protein [Betaproteobacteria bacterium]
MADILIERSHALGMERAREVAAQWQSEAKEEWGMECQYHANEANEQGEVQDRLTFERIGAQGSLCVSATQLKMQLSLGFLMAPYKDRIEEKIAKNLDALLA